MEVIPLKGQAVIVLTLCFGSKFRTQVSLTQTLFAARTEILNQDHRTSIHRL